MVICLASYSSYRSRKGELTKDEFFDIKRNVPTPDDYIQAWDTVFAASIASGSGDIDEKDVYVVAMILGGLSANRIPGNERRNISKLLWLMHEAYAMQGKDSRRLLAPSLRTILGDKPKPDMARIRRLGGSGPKMLYLY